MARARVTYVCRSCGAMHPKWMGKCPDCAAWDSLEESRIDASASKDPQRGLAAGWAAGVAEFVEGGAAESSTPTGAPQATLVGAADGDGAPAARFETGVAEFDRVLGGGFVPGSAILVGGDPGIGKSTLLLQAASGLAGRGVRTLYVSSEESVEQIRMRARRLSAEGQESSDNLWLLADTNLARIVEQARRVRPSMVVIDSIQMIYKADLDASPGSIAQLRRCCTELVYLAKTSGAAIALVGHVTKDGALAGPRLLEHLVDAVLYFEGDRHHGVRVVRAVKNRFGTTLEIGLFEMTGAGLKELRDLAGALPALTEAPRPGSAVVPTITGSRCMLVEVQALTATGFVGAAKRKASGLDANRLAMLIAVLETHGGLRLADRDIFAQAVGGVRIVEPAADLALALAIAGAHFKRALAPGTCAVGEVGLGGEVRPAPQMEARVMEASRLGYTRLIVAKGAEVGAPSGAGKKKLEIVRVKTITEAMEELG